MNDITKFFRPVIIRVLDTHLYFSSRYGMRKPFDKSGRWSGWSPEEVEAHIKRIQDYKKYLPKDKPSNGNGC